MKLTRKGATQEHTLEADLESDKPTKFHYKKLGWRQMNKLNRMKVMDMETAFEVTQIHKAAEADKRELTEQENKRLSELLPIDAEFLDRLAELKAKACEMGLVEIEGMLDDKGKPWDDITVEEFVELADPNALRELGDVIIFASKIPGGQGAAKN